MSGLVEAYRDNGKVKQHTCADLGRKDLLVEILPKLQRFLGGDRADAGEAPKPTSSILRLGASPSPSRPSSTNSGCGPSSTRRR